MHQTYFPYIQSYGKSQFYGFVFIRSFGHLIRHPLFNLFGLLVIYLVIRFSIYSVLRIRSIGPARFQVATLLDTVDNSI